jgi:hypothetical protein
MSCNDPVGFKGLALFARLTPFWEDPRKPHGSAFFAPLQMEPPQQAKTDQADADEVDGYDHIEEPRHDQDQNAGDQSQQGRHVCSGNDH